jgi:hypothetical protein
MSPEDALAQHRAFIGAVGEHVIVRRWQGSGAGRTKAEAQVIARVKGYQATELVGAITQGDISVIALNDPDAVIPTGMVPLSSLLPLLTTDKLVIRGEEKAIKGVNDNTRRVAGVLIALDIHAEG